MSAPIIVGIDGSAHAWQALDWAADHAVRHRLPLRLVHGSSALVCWRAPSASRTPGGRGCG